MPETLEKLRPDRDLQCYFLHPSAIAALSATSPTGFTVSGTWRQQFDWAVIEWNRDNVFEHPHLRNLPDGDLSGLTLSYEETRSNCIPIDSNLFHTVDWPSLRIWASPGPDPVTGIDPGEVIYRVPLKDHAVAIEGVYQAATAEIELGGSVTLDDIVGVAFFDEHYPYRMTANPLSFAVQNLFEGVRDFSKTTIAVQSGTKLKLIYVGNDKNNNRLSLDASVTGANGNRAGLYAYVSGSQTETWDVKWKQFSGGTSPTKWKITLPFGSLEDPDLGKVPSHAIRKLRWTYSAELQAGAFQRSEFQVNVTNWTVTGSGRDYSVAGPGSRRIEDNSTALKYSNAWSISSGNFSGGTIHLTAKPKEWVECDYYSAQTHALYLGTRMLARGAPILISVDGKAPLSLDLALGGEDVLLRYPLGQFEAGKHSVRVTHNGPSPTPELPEPPNFSFYFDFIEIAIPSRTLPLASIQPTLTLATDWDTDHSIALPPERTAWIIDSLGFKGRVNHYAGALWFYELTRTGHQYASGTIRFSGTPDANGITQIFIGSTDHPKDDPVSVKHLNLIGDTAETVAKSFELLINNGYTAIWASANAGTLTIYSRSMGLDGNLVTIGVTPSTANFTTLVSGSTLTGGLDGDWRTDLSAVPRVNRAARDWTQGFCTALKTLGQDSVAIAFSTELQHGDPSPEVGIAQRYPNQDAVIVNTPALQTNFSPQSSDFWQQVYLDMATVQKAAGLQPYLQFGEVQWWYFADGKKSGMPFYDAYTTSTFYDQFKQDMRTITASTLPSSIPEEAAFLPTLIGAYTNKIRAFVLATYSDCRFEVLYPLDVNASALNQVINYPVNDWTPMTLTCLKTESFGYTYARNLDLCLTTINFGASKGFLPSRRSHLVGIGDSSTAWLKEARMAQGKRLESVVLFALDQFCLVGYSLPLSKGLRRSVQLG